MKELSYLDLTKILSEIEYFVGAKIEQIYMPERKELILQLHVPGHGKKLLRINPPNYIYVTEFKPSTDFPPGFCVFLRKKLKNARIQSMDIVPNQRIIRIDLTTKDNVYQLYIELFLKGNVLLCENNKILSPMENQNWEDRTIRGGVDYVIPERDLIPLSTNLNKPLVKFLAVEQNLGGILAEEICNRVGIDKQKKGITDSEVSKISNEIELIYESKASGYIYFKDKKNYSEQDVLVVSPIELTIYDKLECEKLDSLNEALNKVLTSHLKTEIHIESQKGKIAVKNKYQKILDAQTNTLKKIENT